MRGNVKSLEQLLKINHNYNISPVDYQLFIQFRVFNFNYPGNGFFRITNYLLYIYIHKLFQSFEL